MRGGGRGGLLPERGEDKPIARVVVITCVEVLYVLAESSFWQVSECALIL